MNRRLSFRVILALWLVVPLTGCLFRSHKVERQVSAAPLKSATQQELIAYLNSQAAKTKSLQATVDINASVGGSKKGKVTDFQEIRGYILARKPAMLRMIGLMPVVRNRAFDMVSDGQQFKLWIPAKNTFVIGHNNMVQPSTNALENLRPQVIYDALLFQPIEPEKQIAVMESGSETVTDSKGHKVEQPAYEIDVIGRSGEGWYLARKIIFSRTDLVPHRQLIYDERGSVATDARYEDIKDYDGINFPTQIEIERPQEEYSILLKIVKLQLNQPLTEDQFALQQPAGATVKNLDQPRASQGTDGHNQ
ncbi:MAG TPA: outer membrane lipoprotein-sorting protein [Terriglobales bacterium]|jgi:outer membrane lipoprotein-sorting protein